MASPFRSQLRRLARGYARRVGGRRAARVHLLVLVGAVVLAFVSRTFHRLPVLGWLEGRWIPTALVALGVLLLGRPLRWLFASLLRTPDLELAYDLDDRLALQDEAATAAELDPPRPGRPLEAVVGERAGRALARHEAERLWSPARRLRWLRPVLAIVFAFILLGPGVDGLLGQRGVGRQDSGGLGASPDDPDTGRPRPMQAHTWLAWFAEDPLPVEALPPEEGLAPEGGPPPADDAEGDAR